MDALRMAAATLGMSENNSPLDDSLTAIASFPAIMGTYWRLCHDQEPVPIRRDLSHAAYYLHQLDGIEPSPERARALDLGVLGVRLRPLVDDLRQNDFLLRFRVAPYEMTVFADGRAILKGTQDPAVARSLYARYIGA